MKFTGTIARTLSGPTTSEPGPPEYRPRAAFIATKDGVEVFPLDGDPQWAAQMGEDVLALLATMKPKAVLEFLWDRNSTVTTYSRPSTVRADNPEQAAAKLFKREGSR